MRRTLAILTVLAVLSGCSTSSPTTVEPGTGPAATEPSSAVPTEPSSEPTEDLHPEYTEEPTEEVSEEPEVANFQEKYTYTDGLEIEVTKIRQGKVSKEDAEFGFEGEKAGDPYVVLTVRVKNGSKKQLKASSSATVTYGPDGDEAPQVYYDSAEGGPDGTILPGKSKSGVYAFLIPTKYQDDVVMEFTADFDHESAIFAGPALIGD